MSPADDEEAAYEIDIAAMFGAEPLHGERFAVYIPSTDRHQKGIDQRKWVEEALALLSRIGGGATAMPPVEGAWIDPPTGNLIREQPVVVYSSIIPDRFVAHGAELVAFVKRMGRETNQGAVAIEFDGQMYYVEDFGE
jgi:hypothetical protein